MVYRTVLLPMTFSNSSRSFQLLATTQNTTLLCLLESSVILIFEFSVSVVPDMTISNLPEMDLAGFRNSNLTAARFGENLFWDHRTIRLMKLTASAMFSAAVM